MKETEQYLTEDNVAFLISKVDLLKRHAGLSRLKLQNTKLTIEQFGILSFLNHIEDGINQSKLAQLMLKDKPNITRMLNILEESGFICREVSTENNRLSKNVFITEKGRDEIKVIIPIAKEIHNAMLKGLSQDQIDNLKVSLGIICSNLKEMVNLQI